MRRQQLLDVLETLDDPDYANIVDEMAGTLDFERGFKILRYTMPHLQNLDEWDSVLTTFQNRHGELANGVPDTLAECLRRETLSGMRNQIVDPDHRFFLALLLNVPTRKDILAFIAKRIPDQSPIETILGWAEELIEPSDFGIHFLDAFFSESLEVPIEALPQMLIDTLAQALGESLESGDLREDFPEIRATLTGSCLRPLFS